MGGSGGMHGKVAGTGLESRGGGWVVWFIVLRVRSDSRGVFGAFGGWAAFDGCRLVGLWAVMCGMSGCFCGWGFRSAGGDFVWIIGANRTVFS